jgi:hypothetical protein
MKLPRRQFLHLTAGAGALSAVPRITWAQAYPSRPVSLIAGFAPGGGVDITARLIGQWLSERLRGEQLVRRRCTEGHARRDHRQAQQGDQRCPRRSKEQGAASQSGWRRARAFAR